MTPDEAWAEGRRAFDRGAYFEAHELWEVVWHAARGPERAAYRAMIQLAAAGHKLSVQERGPARTLLIRALEGLEPVSSLPDLDLGRLRHDMRRFLGRLEALDPGGLGDLDRADFPRLA